jgi:uncharacterized protein
MMPVAHMAQAEPLATAGLGGLELVFDLSGALWLPGHATLVVADLHLEKGSSFARKGSLLPPYDTAATLAVLAGLMHRYRPARVIALGDSFHDKHAAQRLSLPDVHLLTGMMASCDWVWITGNHDPLPPSGLGGRCLPQILIDDITLRHEPRIGAEREIAGHLHPVAKVRGRGRVIRRRCFALSAQRLILPALGAYAGGLNLRDPAFAPLLPNGASAFLMGDKRIYCIGHDRLLAD